MENTGNWKLIKVPDFCLYKDIKGLAYSKTKAERSNKNFNVMLAQEISACKAVITKFRLEIRIYLTSEKGGPRTAF